MSKKTTVAVLQPGYLPWLGFFDQLLRSDIFVLYDDVAFDKHGWRNRNRIKSPQGPQWLTVPVKLDFFGQQIRDVRIDNTKPWQRKHLGSIKQNYVRATHFETIFPAIEGILVQPWRTIAELDRALIVLFSQLLSIDTKVLLSSELEIKGERSERLLNICRSLGASNYLSGSAARSYLNVSLFEHEGVTVEWQDFEHPKYPQLFGDFCPYLSIVDLLLNSGPTSSKLILRAGLHSEESSQT